jgi:hypothetical protein
MKVGKADRSWVAGQSKGLVVGWGPLDSVYQSLETLLIHILLFDCGLRFSDSRGRNCSGSIAQSAPLKC